MLKGLDLKSAHQFFWTTVQNVKIMSMLHTCIKLRCVSREGGLSVFMQNCYVWLIFAAH